MKRSWIWIVAACLLVYANSFENSFHYDDEHSVYDNIHIRDLGHIGRFFTDPATFSVDHDKGMYRPLLLVSYALNYAVGGYEVGGYHLVNILLHAANACLLWALVWAMGGGRRAALMAGLLFALHPLGSEPVNYISSRSESLAALFYLGGLWSFVMASQREDRAYRVFSWCCLLCGLLSKSSAITLPAVLLLYEILVLRGKGGWRLGRDVLRRHGPYWIAVFGYILIIVANRFLTTSLSKRVRGMDEQLPTQIKALAYYAKLLVWPHGLNVEHQFAVSTGADAAVWPAALLLATVALGLLWLQRKNMRALLFFNSWALVALLPVVVMPLNVLVNERRLYLPAAAFCAALALLLHRPAMRRYTLTIGGAVLVVYAALTWQRNAAWKNDFTLWEDAVSKAPQMPRVHVYMGNAHKDAAFFQRAGSSQANAHWDQARAAYRRALELQPSGELALRALNNLGAVSFVLRDIEGAERAYLRAVELNPDFADALVNLGTVYHERGRNTSGIQGRELLGTSVEYYRRALKQLPNHADAWANLGLAYFDMGDLEGARRAYERALFLNPRNERLVHNFGNYYAALAQQSQGAERQRNLLEARKQFQQALRLNPAYNAPRSGLQYIEEALKQRP